VSTGFDARPLTEPVDRHAAAAFAKALRAQGAHVAAGPAAVIAPIVFVVVMLALLTMGGAFVAAMAGIAVQGGAGVVAALVMLVPLLALAGFVAFGLWLWRGGVRRRDERWYRLDRFARANGMRFLPSMPERRLPGMIFTVGDARRTEDVVIGDQPRTVEFGMHRYETGSGKNRTTHRWGYVAIRLDAPLPHIVLDALGNNAAFRSSNLPASFGRGQRLSLEGDFDRYFALYCPAGYERDALYLFSPDIMARFVDNAAALDVEIIDDWLFLYTKREVTTLDPATWAWLFSVVGALLDKLGQWGRWRDERLAAAAAGAPDPHTELPFEAPSALLRPPTGVAPEGRRLKRRMPWVAIVVAVLVFGCWLAMSTGVFSALFR